MGKRGERVGRGGGTATHNTQHKQPRESAQLTAMSTATGQQSMRHAEYTRHMKNFCRSCLLPGGGRAGQATALPTHTLSLSCTNVHVHTQKASHPTHTPTSTSSTTPLTCRWPPQQPAGRGPPGHCWRSQSAACRDMHTHIYTCGVSSCQDTGTASGLHLCSLAVILLQQVKQGFRGSHFTTSTPHCLQQHPSARSLPLPSHPLSH